MYRLREPRRIGRIADELGWGAFIAFIICFVISVISYIVFGFIVEDDRSSAKQNVEVLKLLDSDGEHAKDMSTATVQHRRQYAQSYLDIAADVKQIKDDGTKLGLSDDQWNQIKEVAKTGKPAKLDTGAMSYDQPFNSFPFTPIWLLCAWIIVGLGALLRYAEEIGYDTDIRMADVRWKRPTTWLTVFLLGPPVWIAMVVSRLLLIWTPLQAERQNRHVEQVIEPEEDDYDEFRGETISQDRVERQRYRSAPAAARAKYITLRTEAAAEYKTRELRSVDYDINDYQSEARALSDRLRNTQTRLNELRSRRKLLEEGIEGTEITTPDLAGQEFDRIRQLPGVVATQVVNDNLRLVIRATHEYKGRVYDLGDWRIDIGPGYTRVEAYGLRSNVRPGWGNQYPVYGYENGLFCFGDRQEILDEHMRKSQYLEAVSVAIDCLCGINKGERKLVPEAFYAIN